MKRRTVLDEEGGAHRTCIALRVARPLDEMIRFVLGPQREVVPDLRRKLPGRGVWVTATASAVRQAMRGKGFARGLDRSGAGIVVPAALAEDIEDLLERDALQWLAIANKAGAVVAGAAKVEAAIAAGTVCALVHAADASAQGVHKLDQALRRRFGEDAAAIGKVDVFSGEQLDLALGRSNVIHAALLGGGACERLLARCGRLAFYRSGAASDAREGSGDDVTATAVRAGPGADDEAMNGHGPGT